MNNKSEDSNNNLCSINDKIHKLDSMNIKLSKMDFELNINTKKKDFEDENANFYNSSRNHLNRNILSNSHLYSKLFKVNQTETINKNCFATNLFYVNTIPIKVVRNINSPSIYQEKNFNKSNSYLEFGNLKPIKCNCNKCNNCIFVNRFASHHNYHSPQHKLYQFSNFQNSINSNLDEFPSKSYNCHKKLVSIKNQVKDLSTQKTKRVKQLSKFSITKENIILRRISILSNHLHLDFSHIYKHFTMANTEDSNEVTLNVHSAPQMHGANFPLAEDGSTYHLETKLTEVANRILTVGDPARAENISKHFDKIVFDKTSHRAFRTITGLFKGVPVTIVAIGMGISAMDFFLRECKAVIEGDMVVVRLGTCGIVKPDIPVGTVVIHDSSVGIIRNPDGFRKIENKDDVSVSTFTNSESEFSNGSESDITNYSDIRSSLNKSVQRNPYYVTLPVNSCPKLTQTLYDNVSKVVGPDMTRIGLNATGDSFYSSQGRQTPYFNDQNKNLIDDVIDRYPTLTTLEMETFHLFDLAECSQGFKIYAGSCVIGLAQRRSEEFLDTKTKKLREKQVGLSVLESLIQFPLENEMKKGVWSD